MLCDSEMGVIHDMRMLCIDSPFLVRPSLFLGVIHDMRMLCIDPPFLARPSLLL
jgi:hypothetical protein